MRYRRPAVRSPRSWPGYRRIGLVRRHVGSVSKRSGRPRSRRGTAPPADGIDGSGAQVPVDLSRRPNVQLAGRRRHGTTSASACPRPPATTRSGADSTVRTGRDAARRSRPDPRAHVAGRHPHAGDAHRRRTRRIPPKPDHDPALRTHHRPRTHRRGTTLAAALAYPRWVPPPRDRSRFGRACRTPAGRHRRDANRSSVRVHPREPDKHCVAPEHRPRGVRGRRGSSS